MTTPRNCKAADKRDGVAASGLLLLQGLLPLLLLLLVLMLCEWI